jgi:integrase
MSKVAIAKAPDLSFLVTSKRQAERVSCHLPLILMKGGQFDWNANAFLTKIGGGPRVYNTKPLASTVVKKAYSLNIFCSHLADANLNIQEVNDSVLYEFVDCLKDRGVTDSTIISHVRLTLQYITFVSNCHPEATLVTNDKNATEDYKVHIEEKKFRKGNREITYLYHHCLEGLIHVDPGIEYIRDYELEKWIDAINCTAYHPDVDEFLLSRWQAFTTLLEITGSRITEVHQISRSSIISAGASLLDSRKNPVIRSIPILKGKYKGKTREVRTTHDDIQVLLWHIDLMERKFPSITHDSIFVDSRNGAALKASYLKNYAKKVINGSKYFPDLRHVTNHSFRHRFITLTVAKELKRLSATGSFQNILTVAATACRKITMHASNETLSRYVHLASEMIHLESSEQGEGSNESTQVKVRLQKIFKIADRYDSKEMSDKEALDSLLATISELYKFISLKSR